MTLPPEFRRLEGIVTMKCPACSRQIPRDNVQPEGFQCPWCKEHLRRGLRGGRVAGLGILILACYLCYAMGARRENIFFGGSILFLLLGAVYFLLTSIYWPKFEKAPLTRDEFPHIIDPPDPSRRP
jgi:hypothetical protein